MTTLAARESEQRSDSRVVGYIDAVSNEAVLGWAWSPGKPDRLRVELRLGGSIIAHAVAGQSRDDLAQNGIGDGRHAFTLAVPSEAREKGELSVVVFPVEGEPVRLEPAPARSTGVETLAPILRGIDTLMNSQRLIHRNLQAALLQQQGPAAAATLSDLAAAQARLAEALTTVELFVVRLETTFKTTTEPARSGTSRHWLILSVSLSFLALLAAGAAMVHLLVGG